MHIFQLPFVLFILVGEPYGAHVDVAEEGGR